MKKKVMLLLVFIFSIYCSAVLSQNKSALGTFTSDTVNSRYFPLAVGNVYKYHYGASNGFNYNYKVRILKDTVIGTKRYFITDNLFPGYIGSATRYDSISGNIYGYSNSGYCSYSPFEKLIDSLGSKKGDSAIVCTFELKHYCTDTGSTSVFGNQIKKKAFTRYTTYLNTTIVYGEGFGIISATYSEPGVLAGESLVGCYINGVLFGDTILTGVNNITSTIPSLFLLTQNYPNPFNPKTIIKYSITSNVKGQTSNVKLTVYNSLGKDVATLVEKNQNAGSYTVEWDGSNFSSGIYFYKLEAGNFSETKRMILLK